MPDRIRAAAVLIAAAMLTSAGCSGEEPTPPPSLRDETSAAPAGYNPCDGLDRAAVTDALGAEVTVQTGSGQSRRCAFIPTGDGGPVLDANYSLFPDGLDAVFDAMGGLDPDDVREVEVAGADAARIVTDFDDSQLFVSGFVQNDDLIQTVDLVAPAPYDEPRLVRGVRMILGDLSAHAGEDPP